MNDSENDAERHEGVLLLLPWYVNDTLEAGERRLVEDHLAACPSCGDELARCKALAAALRSRQETAPSPHPIQLARLMERVEADERGELDFAAPAGQPAHPGRPWSRLLRGTPRPVRWALAGQLAALLLLASAVAVGPARRFQSGGSAPASRASARDAAYVTLSAPSAFGGASTAAVRPQIRLVFAETATEKQMRYVLLCTRGRLVDGPSPLGAYTLELPARTSPAAGPADPVAQPAAPAPPATAPGTPEIQPSSAAAAGAGDTGPTAPRAALAEAAPDSVGTVLVYLRSQPIVRFAEPVAGTTSQPPVWPAAPGGQGTAHGSPPPSRP